MCSRTSDGFAAKWSSQKAPGIRLELKTGTTAEGLSEKVKDVGEKGGMMKQ